MSEKPQDQTTPMKQQAPTSVPVTPGDANSEAASNAASPQKTLNVHAKVFVPKLDDKSLTQTSSQSQFNPSSMKRLPSTPSMQRQMSNQGLPPQNPAAAGFVPPFVPGLVPPFAVPPSPLLYAGLAGIPSPLLFNPAAPAPPVPASPLNVNVGNASLAALRSKEPPKFACVLLVGLPASGKTTVGRDLVQGLISDKLMWSFFSGSDHMSKESGTSRPAPWDTTKEVFQALSNRLDALLKKQADPNERIKGLVIDKNCRGVEDLFYLTALLRSKGLPLVGVVGLEAKEDDVLLARLGGAEELREKLKHHRVIQARIAETARAGGIYRSIDCTKPKDLVVQAMRTMVLGCSAQPPTRNIHSQSYSDGKCPMVDDFDEYSTVMSTLFTLLKPGVKGPQFPGFTEYIPLTGKEMEDRKKINTLKDEYLVRRKVDGVKHVLLYDGKGWYLIPRHMRAVFRVRGESWLGTSTKQYGCMVLDGDLARTISDRGKEMFLVSDVLFFAHETEPQQNIVARSTWQERQSTLQTALCEEDKAFFPSKVDLVIVHQRCSEWQRATELLDPLTYPSDGIVLQPRRSTDPTYIWRPPQSLTVDIRLGSQVHMSPSASTTHTDPGTPSASEKSTTTPPNTPEPSSATPGGTTAATQPSVRTFYVEFYSRDEKKYVQYKQETIEVRRAEAVEGSICICGVAFDDKGPCGWTFHRVRTDVARAAYKNQVEDLLENGHIARSRLVTWLQDEKFVRPVTAQGTAAVDPVANHGTAAPPPPPPAPATNALSRVAFGSALEPKGRAPPPPPTAAPPPTLMQAPPPPAATAANGGAAMTLLQRMLNNNKVQSAENNNGNASKLAQLESMVPRMHVVSNNATPPPPAPAPPAPPAEAPKKASAKPKAAETSEDSDSVPKSCAECKKPKKSEDLRLDKTDNKRYCYNCWAKFGTEFCAECGEFAAGHRESSRRHTTSFYCEPCWKTYNAKEGKTNAKESNNNNNNNTAAKEKDGNKDKDKEKDAKKGTATDATAAADKNVKKPARGKKTAAAAGAAEEGKEAAPAPAPAAAAAEGAEAKPAAEKKRRERKKNSANAADAEPAAAAGAAEAPVAAEPTPTVAVGATAAADAPEPTA